MSSSATFYNKTRSARKIIVVDLGFLGDSIHTLPALRELKRNYPEAALHVLSSELGAELLSLAPFVERAWAFPLGPKSPPWWKHWGILRKLRAERFDLLFNFSGADRTIFIGGCIGARWKIAYPGGREHFWNRWLIPDWISPIESPMPIYEKRREMLARCGLSLEEPKFELQVPTADRDWAATEIPPGTVHFSINASSGLKEWPLANWVNLAKELLAGDPNLMIAATGSLREREQSRLSQLAAEVGSPRVRTFSGASLARLSAIVSRCRYHVGADSGVLHLAFALGIPTVSLFRDYPALSEWAPKGDKHRMVAATCRCLLQPQPDCLAKDEAACLGAVTVGTVQELIGQVCSDRKGLRV